MEPLGWTPKARVISAEQLEWRCVHVFIRKEIISQVLVARAIILSTWEADLCKIADLSLTWKMVQPHLQNNQSKMDRRCGSTAPALQGRCPEFKPQSHQNREWDNKGSP
jgi:hypothetical protein